LIQSNEGASPGPRLPGDANEREDDMSHTPHELHEEFPEHTQLMHTLKMSNGHFQRLSERYHEVNRAIHRAEVEAEPTSDDTLEEMKKQRLHLKDQIAAMLRS